MGLVADGVRENSLINFILYSRVAGVGFPVFRVSVASLVRLYFRLRRLLTLIYNLISVPIALDYNLVPNIQPLCIMDFFSNHEDE